MYISVLYDFLYRIQLPKFVINTPTAGNNIIFWFVMGDYLEKKVSISIPFSTSVLASLACDVLNVDKEIRGSGVQKSITVNGNNLQISFLADDLKRLRVATNSYLKNVLLIVKTINQFN